MAVGALLSGYYQGAYFAMNAGVYRGDADGGFAGIVSEKAKSADEDGEESVAAVPASGTRTGVTMPYTRQITATIKTERMTASMSGAGGMVYSYESSTQQFSMFINSDGNRKTYTVKGTDENGNEFEKEINPYDVDPENADYTEFSALCLYVRQTDDTADLLSSGYLRPGDIFERKDYFSMLGAFSAGSSDMSGRMKDMMAAAESLFDKIQELMDKQMELIDMLFDKSYTEKKLALEKEAEDKAAGVDGADVKTAAKPEYMPYAGSHAIQCKNEYFRLAQGDTVTYEGVVFGCDRKTDTLTLGDVSNENNCIRVGLSNGGSLLFNRDNTDSLMDAITMFSPEDQERIVRAIQIDNMAEKAKKEVEDSKDGDSVRSAEETDSSAKEADTPAEDAATEKAVTEEAATEKAAADGAETAAAAPSDKEWRGRSGYGHRGLWYEREWYETA